MNPPTDDDIASIRCPACGKRPGTPCLVLDQEGQVVHQFHTERTRAYLDQHPPEE